MPTLTKLFSWQEAAEHNSREDCWVVVDGKVYDVTDYLDEHPGGDDVLLRATGKDATDEFDDAGHSKEAIDLMQQYFIGEVDPSSPPPPDAISNKETSTKKEVTGLTQKIMDTTLQYWVVPATVAGISVIVVGLFYLCKK